jgi:FAD/FMN-containing dehydrogenase/Fe-S oxidoreductase
MIQSIGTLQSHKNSCNEPAMNAPLSHDVLLSPAVRKRIAASGLASKLKRHVQGDVLFDAGSKARYSTDASIYQVQPIGVVVPRSEADAFIALEIARDEGVPVLPRGAGTSQCGQTVGEALVIDTSHSLNKLLSVDAENRLAVVQPGMVLDHLNAQLKTHKLWFPVDVSTAAQATIGGMAGNNSCGSRSIAYGNMVHNVAGIDAILADGTEAYFGAFGLNDAPIKDAKVRTLVSKLFELGGQYRDEIGAQYPAVLRRVGGYNLDVFNPQSPRAYTADGSVNLSHLLVGSEGTLAYFKRLHLQLSPLPEQKVLGVVNFASFAHSMVLTQHIVAIAAQAGVLLTAVELVDGTMIRLALDNPAFRPTLEKALIVQDGKFPDALLLVEYVGAHLADLQTQLKRLDECLADHGLPHAVVMMDNAAEQKALWEVRKAGLNIMMSMRGNGKPVSFIEDCAVPLAHLSDYTSALTEVFAKHGTRGTWYAHASVGTLHVRPVLDMRAGDASKMRAIAEEAGALVRRYKGAFSGEHGDGLVRSEWVAWQYGPRLMEAFEQMKALFDPSNRMNPGKIVRAPKMDDTSLMRFPPEYAAKALQPALDWQAWNVTSNAVTGFASAAGTGNDASQGLASAVEMCNNNGHCRKFDAGTMCPSYRVTRQEQDTTRGRANTLRFALTGQWSEQTSGESSGENSGTEVSANTGGLASPAVAQAMALCVSCKGCKRDCPTGVDMAKMKIEVLAAQRAAGKQGWQTRLRSAAVAQLPRYAPWLGSNVVTRGLVNNPLSQWLGAKLLGYASKGQGRSMPKFMQPFTATVRPEPVEGLVGSQQLAGKLSPNGVRKTVILLADTFNNAFEPANLAAARQVLEAAGYAVHVTNVGALKDTEPLCCGRTHLAVGDVAAAQAAASAMIAAVLPLIEQGATLVGLEPSCLLTAHDEWQVMGLGAAAKTVADNALLFESFLVREQQAGRLTLNLKPLASNQALLHGHCHQKAFDVVGDVQTVLGWIPQLKTSLIESSCCGMAGAFGYDAATVAISQAMGELSLLPAVRSASTNTLIVADGTSCRHQIHDFADREALHVARVLAQALV